MNESVGATAARGRTLRQDALPRQMYAYGDKRAVAACLMGANALVLLAMMFLADSGRIPLAVPLAVDLCVTALVFILATPRNEFVAVLMFLMAYYSFILGGNHVLGIYDYRNCAALYTLECFGLTVPDDIVRYQMICGVFKSVLLVLLFRLLPSHSGLVWDEVESDGIELLALGLLLCLTFVGDKLFHRGIFAVGVRYLVVLVAVRLLYRKALKAFPLGRVLGVCAILGLSFLLTRSRTIIAVVLLYVLADTWCKGGFSIRGGLLRQAAWLRLKAVVLLLFCFVSISLYGVWRGLDGAKISISEALLSQSRLESRGEAGLVFLFGSHVSSYRHYGDAPDFLSDSVSDKLWRMIPLIPWKKDMLADRYARYITPEESYEGAGWAFPSIGEWYLYGGMVTLLGFASLAALAIRWLCRRAHSFYWRVLAIMALVSFQRAEVSATGFFVVCAALWIAGIQITRALLMPRNANSPARQRGSTTVRPRNQPIGFLPEGQTTYLTEG